MAETKRMTSDVAVNEEERRIANAMDDTKQEEMTGTDTPKQQQIAAMIDRAERKQAQPETVPSENRQETPPKEDHH